MCRSEREVLSLWKLRPVGTRDRGMLEGKLGGKAGSLK